MLLYRDLKNNRQIKLKSCDEFGDLCYIYIKMKITYPKQQAFVEGAKYRAQNARHKQGVQSMGVPFCPPIRSP